MSEFNDPPQHRAGDAELPEGSIPATSDSNAADAITVSPVGKRKRVKEKKHRSLARRISYWFIGLVALCVLAYGGFYGYVWYRAEHDIKTSDALPRYTGKVVDMLLMGLDSRLDENGKPLPAAVYNALHAGDADSGGENSNVLIYIHISASGKATAISIPRDDWVPIANCTTNATLRQDVPSGCEGKIKSAYGWGLDTAQKEGMSWQKAKDFARREEIQTVENFLQVKITSFVEITMGAFYEIAQQVQPIQVCVKENTTDTFSGAHFKKGLQSLSAKQAVAFVRQRRDAQDRYNFSDLDRSRRQQAFIVSLLTKLKSAGTLLNPITLNNIINVASTNVVKSDGIDPISLAKLASSLGGNNFHLYTLPIVTANYYPPSLGGAEVANQVNTPEIRAIVKSLLNPAPPSAKPKPKAKPTKAPLPSGAGYTVNAQNASGVPHAAANLVGKLTKFKYTAGTAVNAATSSTGSTITYNPADKTAAQALAQRLNATVTLVASSSAASHVLTLTIGTTLANTANPIRSTAPAAPKKTAPTSIVPSAVAATGGGIDGPGINQLTVMGGSGIPCVK